MYLAKFYINNKILYLRKLREIETCLIFSHQAFVERNIVIILSKINFKVSENFTDGSTRAFDDHILYSTRNINCALAMDEGNGGSSRCRRSCELSRKRTVDICHRPANAPLHKKLGKLTYNRLNS